MISNLNTNSEEIEQNMKKVEYESFDGLTCFSDTEDYEFLENIIVTNLNDERNWLNQYEALNTLRRLNKYSSIVFNSILPRVILLVTKLTSSIRSNLSKLSLMLIKEIFMSQNLSTQNFKYLRNMINSVVSQSGTMKTFIKDESLQGLNFLSSNYYFFNSATLSILIEEVSSKSLAHSENAFNTIIKLFENWSKEDIFSGTNYSQWEAIFNLVANLYSLKREPYSKRACKVIETVYTKFGEEDFQNIINSLKLDNSVLSALNVMVKLATEAKKKKITDCLKNHIVKNKFSNK